MGFGSRYCWRDSAYHDRLLDSASVALSMAEDCYMLAFDWHSGVYCHDRSMMMRSRNSMSSKGMNACVGVMPLDCVVVLWLFVEPAYLSCNERCRHWLCFHVGICNDCGCIYPVWSCCGMAFDCHFHHRNRFSCLRYDDRAFYCFV